METTTYGLQAAHLLSRHISPYVVERAEKERLSGRLEHALSTCEEVLKQWPYYVSALIVLARVHVDREDLCAAEEALQDAVSHDPMNAVALTMLARVCLMLGYGQDAIKWAERALFFHPSDADARAVLQEATRTTPAAETAAVSASPPRPAARSAAEPAAEIETIRALSGVTGVMLTDPQGLPIDGSLGRGDKSDAEAAARMASALSAWAQVWRAAGRPLRAMVSANQGQIVIESEAGAVLITVLSPRVRPGRVLETIHTAAQRLLAGFQRR